MGWTETMVTKWKNGKVDKMAEVIDCLEGENKYGKWEVLKSSLVGSVAYVALKYTDPKGISEVFGTVVKTSVRKEGAVTWFGYKAIDESEGPVYYDCPKGILDMLPPTDNEISQEWRAECRRVAIAKNEKRKSKTALKNLPIGSAIKVHTDQGDVTLFKREYRGKSIWWDCQYKYPISYIERCGYEVEE